MISEKNNKLEVLTDFHILKKFLNMKLDINNYLVFDHLKVYRKNTLSHNYKVIGEFQQ